MGSRRKTVQIHELEAISLVFSSRRYTLIFISLSTLTSVLYSFLLPSLPFGKLMFDAIYYITPLQITFAVLFGLLISLVIVLDLLSFKLNVSSVGVLTVSSVLSSLVNGLCCTPIIPSLLALFSAYYPFLTSYSPRIQAFFEFNYSYFYLVSVLLLLLSVHYLSKSLSCCKGGKG